MPKQKHMDIGSSKAKKALFQDKPADTQTETGHPYKFNKPIHTTKFNYPMSII